MTRQDPTGRLAAAANALAQGRDHSRADIRRPPSCCPPDPQEVVMSCIRRITVMLAGLAGAALAFSQAAPCALAVPPPPNLGGTKGVPRQQSTPSSSAVRPAGRSP
jgi:hypothetical protein